jgi:hypothetical protein
MNFASPCAYMFSGLKIWCFIMWTVSFAFHGVLKALLHGSLKIITLSHSVGSGILIQQSTAVMRWLLIVLGRDSW